MSTTCSARILESEARTAVVPARAVFGSIRTMSAAASAPTMTRIAMVVTDTAQPITNDPSPTTYTEWPGAESNCRHADFQSAALPTELPGRNESGNLAGTRDQTQPETSRTMGTYEMLATTVNAVYI